MSGQQEYLDGGTKDYSLRVPAILGGPQGYYLDPPPPPSAPKTVRSKHGLTKLEEDMIRNMYDAGEWPPIHFFVISIVGNFDTPFFTRRP